MALPHNLRDKLSLPLVAAPLFIVSNPELVIAQCKAGIVGSFPALNARPAAELEAWLQRITAELEVNNIPVSAGPWAYTFAQACKR